MPQENKIVLEPVDVKTNRTQTYALTGDKAYTLSTIARFLNWVNPSDGQATRACRLAFDAFREQASTAEALRLKRPYSNQIARWLDSVRSKTVA
jgi:hypothetical protein